MEDQTNNRICGVVEALLFVSGEPLAPKVLANLTESTEEEVNNALVMLESNYLKNASGLSIVRAPEGVQLATNKQYASQVDKFLKSGIREQLTPAAAETLAIVAYRGPINRAGVEAIRGVNASFSLRLLTIRGLVERYQSEKDSRVFLYRVSADFLRHLGLSKIEDLPDYQNFRQNEVMTRLEKTADQVASSSQEKEEI